MTICLVRHLLYLCNPRQKFDLHLPKSRVGSPYTGPRAAPDISENSYHTRVSWDVSFFIIFLFVCLNWTSLCWSSNIIWVRNYRPYWFNTLNAECKRTICWSQYRRKLVHNLMCNFSPSHCMYKLVWEGRVWLWADVMERFNNPLCKQIKVLSSLPIPFFIYAYIHSNCNTPHNFENFTAFKVVYSLFVHNGFINGVVYESSEWREDDKL